MTRHAIKLALAWSIVASAIGCSSAALYSVSVRPAPTFRVCIARTVLRFGDRFHNRCDQPLEMNLGASCDNACGKVNAIRLPGWRNWQTHGT